MRRTILGAVAVGALVLAALATHRAGVGPPPEREQSTIAQSLTPPAYPQSRIDDALIQFPLPSGEEAYASIDGKKLHEYVVELAEISRRYRDDGHPKYWGRIIGSSADHETV